MGKYLIKVESMDMNEPLDERYGKGIECDGFVIMADQDDGYKVCIHHLNVNDISAIIAEDSKLLGAGMLAKARREVADMMRREEKSSMLSRMLGME